MRMEHRFWRIVYYIQEGYFEFVHKLHWREWAIFDTDGGIYDEDGNPKNKIARKEFTKPENEEYKESVKKLYNRKLDDLEFE